MEVSVTNIGREIKVDDKDGSLLQHSFSEGKCSFIREMLTDWVIG